MCVDVCVCVCGSVFVCLFVFPFFFFFFGSPTLRSVRRRCSSSCDEIMLVTFSVSAAVPAPQQLQEKDTRKEGE